MLRPISQFIQRICRRYDLLLLKPEMERAFGEFNMNSSVYTVLVFNFIHISIAVNVILYDQFFTHQPTTISIIDSILLIILVLGLLVRQILPTLTICINLAVATFNLIYTGVSAEFLFSN